MLCANGWVRLPFAFDARSIAAEADALDPAVWEAHFNRALYRGDWSGVILRGNGGSALYPNPHSSAPFADTAELAHCPSVRRAIAALSCQTTAVRFLRLGPGSEIYEHRDYDLTPESNEARLHLCVRSNEDVRFELDGRLLPMQRGECWYVDVSRPHRVVNAGTSDRLHLVVDCLLDARLRETIALSAATHG